MGQSLHHVGGGGGGEVFLQVNTHSGHRAMDRHQLLAVGIWRHEDVSQAPFKQSGRGRDRDQWVT